MQKRVGRKNGSLILLSGCHVFLFLFFFLSRRLESLVVVDPVGDWSGGGGRMCEDGRGLEWSSGSRG